MELRSGDIVIKKFVRNLRIFVLGLKSVCQNRLEKRVKYKHYSLLWKFINYGRKKFDNIGPKFKLSP